jgi:hypothetical protein
MYGEEANTPFLPALWTFKCSLTLALKISHGYLNQQKYFN